MKRLAIGIALLAALAAPAAVSAHPSENRSDTSVFGGPHCHVVTTSGVVSFVSHGAHLAQIAHKPGGAIFTPTACP